MIANDIFGGCFGITTPGDNSPETTIRVAKAAARAGIAVLLIDPTSKKPICPLAARASKEADQAAQDTAREAGRSNWQAQRHDCGVGHATTDDKLLGTWLTRLTKKGDRFNLAVAPGKARMIAIDVDTAAEKAAWLADRTAAEGVDRTGDTPTVLSPGVMNTGADGEENWVHKDGGHYWFTLPEGVDFSESPTSKYAAETGWVAMFGPRSYVLVPPSNRKEGPYQLVGQAEEAPEWLLDRITGVVAETVERRERSANRVRFDDDPIDTWAATTTWEQLLTSDGWIETGKPDSCSVDCMVWTKPGGAANPKSATAHAEGCGKYDLVNGHGPLHLWTDVPPEFLPGGTRTFTKLQYVAHREHGGDMGEAMKALNLGALGGTTYEFLDGPAPDVDDEDDTPVTEPLPEGKFSIDGEDDESMGLPDEEPPADEDVPPVTEPEEDEVIPAAPEAKKAKRPELGEEAMHGIAGDIVRVLEPSTEADPNALLFVFLSMVGTYFGRKPHQWAGASEHPARLWPLLVGKTAQGKKGTAISVITWFFKQFDEDFMLTCQTSGLSTAEGLIREVHEDPKDKDAPAEGEEGFDPGVAPMDKRRVIVEHEFATLLGRARRENNVISAALREAYDGVPMRVKTKTDPLMATDHHINIIGCITPEELLAKLTDTDIANGLANRFMVVHSLRSKSLPRDVPFDKDAVRQLVSRLDQVARKAEKVSRLDFTEKGAKVWDDYYRAMDARNLPDGRVVDLINRWNANTLRLAVTYALLDGSRDIDEVHVKAAIACWEYVEGSINFVFNDEEQDKDLQRLMEFINSAELGFRARNEVYERLFNKGIGKKDLDDLLKKLTDTGKYEARKVQQIDEKTQKPKGGRPTWVYSRRSRSTSKPAE